MSTTEQTDDGSETGPLSELPEFELRYLFDDGEDPSRVTVFSPEDLQTTWITADRDATIPLEEVR